MNSTSALNARSESWSTGRAVKRHKRLAFPLIIKSLSQEGSVGISQASIVDNDDKIVVTFPAGFDVSGAGFGSVGGGGIWDAARHLVLPVTTLTIFSIGSYKRYVRAAMIEASASSSSENCSSACASSLVATPLPHFWVDVSLLISLARAALGL